MIVEWLLSVGAAISEWVASLMPPVEIPDEIVNVDDSINDLFALGSGLGAWVDWALCAIVLGIPLTIWVVGLSVRALRALIAHVPFFGGGG